MLLRYFSWTILIIPILAQDTLPFCKLCKCETKNGKIQVTCESNLGTSLFDEKNWLNIIQIDNKTNVTNYPYHTFAVHNSPILTLDKTFPNSSLTYLDLGRNSIVNIADGVFKNLQKMQTLTLINNNIETIHPNAFEGAYMEGDYRPLRALKNLHLDFNRIHSLDADLFEHTSQIELLTLSHNPLKVLDHQTVVALTSLVYLKHLDLSHTELKDLPDHFLHTPKFLSVLELSGNAFDHIPATLEDSHNLTILHLDNNPIVNLTSENGFPKIPTLEVLHLSNMKKLRRITKGALSNLENLMELYCFENEELKYIDAHALTQSHDEQGDHEAQTWPPLRKLYLQKNKLSSLDMGFILHWQDLVALDLTDNVWTCECENQWMVDELMPVYLKIDEEKAKKLKCSAPIEMVPFTLYDVYQKHSEMRCLDRYGNRPERDGVLLVGILAGVLITIPLLLFLVYAYRRHWFGLFDKSPAAFSRQFYTRGNSNDDNF